MRSTCSDLARALGEPLHGTAPHARTWVAVEQPGPWGRQALQDSHLDPAVGTALERWADGTGVKVVLIRRPGRHPDGHVAQPHTVLVAHSAPGAAWLERLWVADPAELLSLDAAALSRGVRAGIGVADDGGVALVCTNGRRDRCCAVHGRAVALALAADHPGRVWECSHLGGHRFAPTAAFLPSGVVYGQLDHDRATRAWVAAEDGRLILDGLRGRSWLPPIAQVADDAVRRSAWVDELTALAVSEPSAVAAGLWTVAVSHRDGHRWTVTVEAGESTPPRPESCGKAAVTPRLWRVSGLAVDGLPEASEQT